MPEINVLASLDFPYQFIIEDPNNHSGSEDAISHWCRTNCSSMWMISSPITFSFYSPPAFESPIYKEKFMPSRVNQRGIMVAFQAEDEAMAFKLTHVDGKK